MRVIPPPLAYRMISNQISNINLFLFFSTHKKTIENKIVVNSFSAEKTAAEFTKVLKIQKGYEIWSFYGIIVTLQSPKLPARAVLTCIEYLVNKEICLDFVIFK